MFSKKDRQPEFKTKSLKLHFSSKFLGSRICKKIRTPKLICYPSKFWITKDNLKKIIFEDIFRISEISFCAIAALWLTLIYNFITIRVNVVAAFSSIKLVDLALIVSATAFTFWLCFLIFLLLSFLGQSLKFLISTLFFLSTISLYIHSKFGIIFDEVMLINALDSVGHTSDAIDLAIFGYFLIFFVAPTALIFLFKLQKASLKRKFVALVICALVNGSFATILKEEEQQFVFKNFSPINYFGSIQLYFSRFHKNREIAKNRIELSKLYRFSTKNLPKNLNIIIVIGESLRADHLGINGYERDTTHRLAKIENLLNFRSQAKFNTTSPALTSLLSHRLDSEFTDIPPEKSLINLAKNLGFKTYWFSAQSSKEFGNGMLNIMALEADEYFFRNHLLLDSDEKNEKKFDSRERFKIYDEALLPFLKSALKPRGRNLIILHSFGSHIRYHERSPDKFKNYLPECRLSPASCSHEELINAYDNSVFYTDFFLSKVIENIEGTDSIMFYISDHGNYLGENGQFANGNPSEEPKAQHIVPMMIYASKQLAKKSGFKERLMRAKAKKDKLLSHDYFFDSVLGCIGVESPLIDQRNLNLCR